MKHPMIRKICRFSTPFHANPMDNPCPDPNPNRDLVLMKRRPVTGFFFERTRYEKDGLPGDSAERTFHPPIQFSTGRNAASMRGALSTISRYERSQNRCCQPPCRSDGGTF